MQHTKTVIFFFLRTEHGRQYFPSPRYGNGPKHHKTKHKEDLGNKSFAALVSNFRPKHQRAAHGRRNFRGLTVRRATEIKGAAHITVWGTKAFVAHIATWAMET